MSLTRSIALRGFALAILAAVGSVISVCCAEETLCQGRRFDLVRAGGGFATHIRAAAAGAKGAFLIDYGATRSSLSADDFPGARGPMSADVDLPGFSRGSFALRRYRMSRQPEGGLSGVIGTDFLSLITAQISDEDVYLGEEPCDGAALEARGFTPISQRGFFSADLARTTPGRPNVPVVFVRIGGLRAFAQIDTGYDDSLEPHSVDVNEPFFDALEHGGAALERGRDIWVATCDGRESRRVYRVVGRPLMIENEQGAPIRRVDDFALIVKRPNGCGGIALMSTPAAQLGASFLKTFGTTIFDPKADRVWIGGEAGGR
ncbi:hypothetical protein [Methylocella sp.]|uniref:hypothetical protein n=1 Tax=Methylocella sp. TaxID=1978226 RepID=UPI003783F152